MDEKQERIDELESALRLIEYHTNGIYGTNNLYRSAVGSNPTNSKINNDLQKIRVYFERIGFDFDW